MLIGCLSQLDCLDSAELHYWGSPGVRGGVTDGVLGCCEACPGEMEA